MLKFKPEYSLKKLARNMPNTVVERATKINGEQEERDMTDAEKEVMFNITYGTLLKINSIAAHSMATPSRRDFLRQEKDAAIDAAEYIFARFFPTCNTYDSFFIPLEEVLDAWAEESWDIPVKEWYATAFPERMDATLEEYMDPTVTFRDLHNANTNGESWDEVLGVGMDHVHKELRKALDDVRRKY